MDLEHGAAKFEGVYVLAGWWVGGYFPGTPFLAWDLCQWGALDNSNESRLHFMGGVHGHAPRQWGIPLEAPAEGATPITHAHTAPHRNHDRMPSHSLFECFVARSEQTYLSIWLLTPLQGFPLGGPPAVTHPVIGQGK